MPAYLFSIPFIVILFISILYLQINKKYRKSSIYLLLSLRLLILCYNLFIVYGNQIPFLSTITFYLTYSDAMFFSLSGPLFYFFLLEVLNERTFTSASNAKHLWPVIPGMMFCATFSSLPHPLKVESFYGNSCGILPDDLLYAGEVLGIVFYIILSIMKVNKYLLHHRGKLSQGSIKQLHVYSWFLHFSFALCIGYGILTMATPHPIGIQMIIIFFLMVQSMSELLLVFCIKHLPVSFISETNGNIINTCNNVENDHHTGVNKVKLNAAALKLENIMNEQKLYLNHDLDVDLLVKKSGLNSNQIKTSIREKYSMTVPEFLNMYRIEHAKNLLSDTNSSIKIDILAHECGYSTRSNFYRAFKSATGLTPNEYRNSIMRN